MNFLKWFGASVAITVAISLPVYAMAEKSYGPGYETVAVEIEETIEPLTDENVTIVLEVETQEEEEEEEETETPVPLPTYSASDLRYMASIIYAEAGNQCLAGQQAVGIVVMNRSQSSQWANGIYNVIYEKGQFTPVYDGNMNKALALYDRGGIPSSCVEAAKYAIDGNKTVSYNGALIDLSGCYYFSTKMKNPKYHIQGHYFR